MAVAAGALVLGLSFLGSAQPNNVTDPDVSVPSSVPTPAVQAPLEQVVTTEAEPLRARVSDDVLRSARVAQAFADQIDQAGATYGVAYATEGGVVVLDGRGISEPDIEIAQQFQHVSQFAMLTGQGRTWAIDADDRTRSYLVSNMYVVVEAERSGTIAVIDEENGTIGLLSAGLPIPSIEVPSGAELIAVQERGVLVLPAEGGTLELSGTASSLVQLSDAHAVSASTGAIVYEQCAGDDACSHTVVTHEPVATYPLLVPSESVVDVSPKGRWVVVRTNEESLLIDVESGRTTNLGPGPTTEVSWAPGGEFVALGRSGKIDIYVPDQSRSITLDTNETAALLALVAFVS